jgi:hypothetical protein
MIGRATPSEYGTPDGMWKDAYWVVSVKYQVPPAEVIEVLRRHVVVLYPQGHDLFGKRAPTQLRLISGNLAGMFGDIHYSVSAYAELEENAERLGLANTT